MPQFKNLNIKNIKLLLTVSIITITSYSSKAQNVITQASPIKICTTQIVTNTPYLLNTKETSHQSQVEITTKNNKAIENKIATLQTDKKRGTLTEKDAKLLAQLERIQAKRLTHNTINSNMPTIIQKTQ